MCTRVTSFGRTFATTRSRPSMSIGRPNSTSKAVTAAPTRSMTSFIRLPKTPATTTTTRSPGSMRGDRCGLEAAPPGAGHGDHLARGLEHLAEIQTRWLEDLLVERRLVLDHRRLRHRTDDPPRNLGGARDHQDRAVESSSPMLSAHAASPFGRALEIGASGAYLTTLGGSVASLPPRAVGLGPGDRLRAARWRRPAGRRLRCCELRPAARFSSSV